MAYKIKANEVAYVRATEEPVFVVSIADGVATVNRVVETKGNALVYGVDTFSEAELYTDKGRLIYQLDLMKFQAQKRSEYSEEYNRSQAKLAVPAASPQADGDSTLLN